MRKEDINTEVRSFIKDIEAELGKHASACCFLAVLLLPAVAGCSSTSVCRRFLQQYQNSGIVCDIWKLKSLHDGSRSTRSILLKRLLANKILKNSPFFK